MKELKKHIKKAFSINNIISRVAQYAISIVTSMIVYALTYHLGVNELGQGFYSGMAFYFMIEKLEGIFRKR